MPRFRAPSNAGYDLREYQLKHLGPEVNGGGFGITGKAGRLISSADQLVGLPHDFPPLIPEETARDLAFRAQDLNAPAPWLAKPGVFHPPRATLIWAVLGAGAKPGEYVLSWSFDFQRTGASFYPTVVIDAITGELVYRYSGFVN